MVESLTHAREVMVRYLPPPLCVLYEQRQITPRKFQFIPRNQWLCPDRIEDLLTGTLSLESAQTYLTYTSEQQIYTMIMRLAMQHWGFKLYNV